MTKKNIIAFCIVSAILIQATSKVRVSRQVGSFDKIWIGSGIDLHLTTGNDFQIIIECNNDNTDEIFTTVTNGQLKIRASKSIKWDFGQPPKVFVPYGQLKQIRATGGSDVYASTTIKSDTLTLTANGGSDVYLSVDCNYINISANNGSAINLSGKTNVLLANAQNGSDISTPMLASDSCTIYLSGGSEALIQVNSELGAQVLSNSRLGYIGKPPHLNITDDGTSDIYRK